MHIKIHDIDVEIIQKKIKNIHLRICPPTGAVRVSAPKKMAMKSIHQFVISNLEWIQKQQGKMRANVYDLPKEYVDNEKHYFNGQCFLLKIVAHEKKPYVTLSDSHIVMAVNLAANKTKRQALLDRWYGEQLKEKTALLITQWEKKMGVSVSRLTIRNMKTRWGSCSPTSRAIRINLALAKTSLECLEYVVVHELAHLLEASHNKRFVSLMDQFLPTWRLCRRALNGMPMW